MVGGCERGCVVGGSGGELVNLPPYVGVEHRIILAANAQCHIRIPFILFSIQSSLILWLGSSKSVIVLGIRAKLRSICTVILDTECMKKNVCTDLNFNEHSSMGWSASHISLKFQRYRKFNSPHQQKFIVSFF